MILNILLLASGAYFTGFGVMMHTSNALSGFVFKAIPAVLGLPLMFFGIARIMGWPV